VTRGWLTDSRLQEAEDDQRGELNHVDGQVDGRRRARPSMQSIDEDREENRHQRHEERPRIRAVFNNVGVENQRHSP